MTGKPIAQRGAGALVAVSENPTNRKKKPRSAGKAKRD
jgi:hypothetical protein